MQGGLQRKSARCARRELHLRSNTKKDKTIDPGRESVIRKLKNQQTNSRVQLRKRSANGILKMRLDYIQEKRVVQVSFFLSHHGRDNIPGHMYTPIHNDFPTYHQAITTTHHVSRDVGSEAHGIHHDAEHVNDRS